MKDSTLQLGNSNNLRGHWVQLPGTPLRWMELLVSTPQTHMHLLLKGMQKWWEVLQQSSETWGNPGNWSQAPRITQQKAGSLCPRWHHRTAILGMLQYIILTKMDTGYKYIWRTEKHIPFEQLLFLISVANYWIQHVLKIMVRFLGS